MVADKHRQTDTLITILRSPIGGGVSRVQGRLKMHDLKMQDWKMTDKMLANSG